jgi:hypothetical protein
MNSYKTIPRPNCTAVAMMRAGYGNRIPLTPASKARMQQISQTSQSGGSLDDSLLKSPARPISLSGTYDEAEFRALFAGNLQRLLEVSQIDRLHPSVSSFLMNLNTSSQRARGELKRLVNFFGYSDEPRGGAPTLLVGTMEYKHDYVQHRTTSELRFR